MSDTLTSTNGNAPPSEEERARQGARNAWRESGGTLTGTELGERYGYTPRWGRKQITLARREGTTPRPKAARPAAPKAARPARPRATTPPALVAVAVLAAATVALVTAVVSYAHVRHLAAVAGAGDLAYVLPLGLDGLVVLCSCTLLVDRRRRAPRHGPAVVGLVLGVLASLAANVFAVYPELAALPAVRGVLAGYTPVALLLAGHLLLRLLGDR